VKVNKNGDQLDIGRVLSLYKAILSGEKIHYKVLYDYATEAMDKGLKQLGKSNIDNYYNMGITRYINGYEDFFIKRIIFGYMVLINLCQDLGILDNTIFTKIRKEENAVDTVNSPSEKVNHAIKRIEDFLDSQGFSKKIRSMFYLGILINRVAMAQVRKEHKKKPILQKIQFQGMNEKEVYSLYMDVVEKLRQYDIMTLFSEAVMNRFHYYYEPVKGTFNNDKENVFYVMAGYSYMVGNKAPDMTEEEEKAMKESIENVD
jgi:CRISPR-associated protein Csh1